MDWLEELAEKIKKKLKQGQSAKKPDFLSPGQAILAVWALYFIYNQYL